MNKVVLLTGTSGGIGKATSLVLLEKGYTVIGVDITENDINNPKYDFYKCDLSKFDSIEELYSKVSKKYKHIDVIFNIAGIFKMQTMVEGNDQDLKKMLDVNFFAAYKINKTFLPLLDNTSRIIVFSSEIARYSPQPFNGYYAVSKIAVDKYADVLRRELNYLGIKVIKVQSGSIKTKLLDGANSEYNKAVSNTKYYKKPLTKLKKLMDDELNKQVDPLVAANKLTKIAEKKNPRMLYKIKNSFKLRILNRLPESLQDYIYIKVIK